MFQRALQWMREVWTRMIGQLSVKQVFQVEPAISPSMNEAIQLWSQMYENKAPWLNKEIHSLNLPAAIASEITRAATMEMQVKLTGSIRADFIFMQIAKILPRLREKIEVGVAKGGLIVKPYINNKSIVVDYIQADQFIPVSHDNNGNITGCIFIDQQRNGNVFFTRLEYHQFSDEMYQIRNLAFRSNTPDVLGQQISLTAIEKWADLLPEAVITGIDSPLFAYFRFPLTNNIDSGSPLGVSCYSRAVDLIQDADRQWSNLLWEFESGQRALYVDVLAFGKDKAGKPVLPNQRLYRTINRSGQIGSGEDLFNEWSPSLRETNIINGLEAILRKIEFECGLAYGTISNPQTVDKTATEIKISRQRTYSTIVDTQKAIKTMFEQLLYAMDMWTTLGNLAPRGSYTAIYDFDDSVVVDKDLQFQQDLRLVTQGLMSKVEFRMRNFGEDEVIAKEMIAAIQMEQSPDIFQQ